MDSPTARRRFLPRCAACSGVSCCLPTASTEHVSAQHRKQRSARRMIAGAAFVAAAAAVLLWRYTPLAEWADPELIAAWMERMRESAWAPLVVIAAFVVGGLVVFPLTLLITATAIVFAPWIALALSVTGAMLNAITLYFIGRGLM